MRNKSVACFQLCAMTNDSFSADARFPPNIGILAMDAYFPSTYVDQEQLGTRILYFHPFLLSSRGIRWRICGKVHHWLRTT